MFLELETFPATEGPVLVNIDAVMSVKVSSKHDTFSEITLRDGRVLHVDAPYKKLREFLPLTTLPSKAVG